MRQRKIKLDIRKKILHPVVDEGPQQVPQGYGHKLKQSLRSIQTTFSGTSCDSWGDSMQRQDLDCNDPFRYLPAQDSWFYNSLISSCKIKGWENYYLIPSKAFHNLLSIPPRSWSICWWGQPLYIVLVFYYVLYWQTWCHPEHQAPFGEWGQ